MQEDANNNNKQVRITRRMAAVISSGVNTINDLGVELKNVEQRIKLAAHMQNNLLIAVVEDAGLNPADFKNYAVWEDNGEMYLRAQL